MRKALKKWISLCLAVCVLAGGAGLLSPRGAAMEVVSYGDFKDLDIQRWYVNYLNEALRKGFFYGVSETEFEPERAISRGEAVTVLGRMWLNVADGLIEEPADQPFEDVALGRYYTPYIAWAKENGLVSGMTETTFEPNRPVTQQELAVLFDRYIKVFGSGIVYEPAPEGEETLDGTQVSKWAAKSVQNVSGYDIFQESHWNPQEAALRGECAAFFVWLYERLIYSVDEETPRLMYYYDEETAADWNGGDELESRPAYSPDAFAEAFHILKDAFQGGWYQVVDDQETLDALTEQLERYGTQVEIAPTLSANLFEEHSVVAVEVKRIGDPGFQAELGECKAAEITVKVESQQPESGDDGNSGSEPEKAEDVTLHDIHCTLNLNGGSGSSTADMAGYVFFLEVPKGVNKVTVDTVTWTEDYRGLGAY